MGLREGTIVGKLAQIRELVGEIGAMYPAERVEAERKSPATNVLTVRLLRERLEPYDPDMEVRVNEWKGLFNYPGPELTCDGQYILIGAAGAGHDAPPPALRRGNQEGRPLPSFEFPYPPPPMPPPRQ